MSPGGWMSIVALLGSLALDGCGTALLQKDAPRMERTLIEAGFKMIPADTAEKVAQLQALPSYKLVKRTINGNVRYVYADPTGCQCAYVGGAEQYALYKRYIATISSTEADALEARMATEEQAEEIEDAWDPL